MLTNALGRHQAGHQLVGDPVGLGGSFVTQMVVGLEGRHRRAEARRLLRGPHELLLEPCQVLYCRLVIRSYPKE